MGHDDHFETVRKSWIWVTDKKEKKKEELFYHGHNTWVREAIYRMIILIFSWSHEATGGILKMSMMMADKRADKVRSFSLMVASPSQKMYMYTSPLLFYYFTTRHNLKWTATFIFLSLSRWLIFQCVRLLFY